MMQNKNEYLKDVYFSMKKAIKPLSWRMNEGTYRQLKYFRKYRPRKQSGIKENL